VTWDRLAEVCGRYLGKGQQVAIEGRIQTRTWDDDKGLRHWKTEIVATTVEMLSGRKKKDYAAESSADAIEAVATAADEPATDVPTVPADEPIAEELAA
jgi:single-strand DNA-binding protein